MSERSLTADARQDVEPDEPGRSTDATFAARPESVETEADSEASVESADSVTSASDAEPASPPRRSRTRSKASGTSRQAAEFDPTSRGDEGGEVM